MPIRLVSLFVLALAFSAAQQRDNKPAVGFRGEFLLAYADAESKVLSLAKAVPAEKYAWRPADGVRSVAEVYMHIANGNRFLLTLMKGSLAGEELEKTIQASFAREKSVKEKMQIISELERAFQEVRQTLDKASDAELARPVKFFGTDTTVRGIFNVISNHVSEHLGQSIAYARVTGVVPPWSAKQGGQ